MRFKWIFDHKSKFFFYVPLWIFFTFHSTLIRLNFKEECVRFHEYFFWTVKKKKANKKKVAFILGNWVFIHHRHLSISVEYFFSFFFFFADLYGWHINNHHISHVLEKCESVSVDLIKSVYKELKGQCVFATFFLLSLCFSVTVE